MLNFLTINWQNLLVILIVLVLILVLLRLGCRKQVDKILLYLVIKAEATFGGGTGELKFASMVTWLYDRLPSMARWIFTKKQIDAMIEAALTEMKRILSNNEKANKLVTDNLNKNIE